MSWPRRVTDEQLNKADAERLRDTFAAAALTGLLAAPTDKDRSWDYWARLSYEAADAMLRERERVTEPMTKEKRAEVSSAPVFADKTRSWPVSYEKSDEKRVLHDTNHDAAPAARACADGELAPKCGGEAGLNPRDGTGNTQEPVGWLVKQTGDDREWFVKSYPHSIADRCTVTPLYRSPTLTDEERGAIDGVVAFLFGLADTNVQAGTGDRLRRHAATLRSLLERTKCST
jgi:hypothetical protein